jgi:mRNA-degrading endonuclease RelE of RelBE toxin-antitoxin system
MRKLSKKDKSLYEQLIKKIDEIKRCYDIEHYKNLRHNMKDSKRAHIGHFVLVFQFDKKTNTINFDDFDHHDRIYKK